MSTADQRKSVLEAATGKLTKLADVDPKTLARTSDLSPDINFKDAVPHFEKMLDVCKQLSQRDLSRLTHPQLTSIIEACDRLEALISQVRDFTLNQNTPGDVCTNIIQAVDNGYDQVMDPFLLPLAFTSTQATDYAKIEREAKGYHATMKAEADKLSSFLATVRTDAERALAAVKEQAAEAGVATNAQIFVGEASSHGIEAGTWLQRTAGMAIAISVVAIAAVITAFVYNPAGLSATIQYVVAKLVLLSILSFLLLWCAKNYRSEKHNQTLNKHRANALMTFRAFVEGTSDARIKDAILLQAAQAAFSGRSTGFDSVERDSQTINPVVEILGKTITESGE